MTVSIIAAMAENRVIGRNGRLPWHLPEDLRHFRELTWGHPVIMGRATFQSIGHPLPGRRTLVLTRSPHLSIEGVELFPGLAEALTACGEDEEIFVCGGEEVYRAALPLAARIYLTVVGGRYAGDVIFPEIPEEFVETGRVEGAGPPPFIMLVLEKTRAAT